METNPYKAPDEDEMPPAAVAATTSRSGVQFSLQMLFILAADMIAGGQTALSMARSETWLKGGVPVGLSAFGEAFFFTIGGIAGVVGSFAVINGPSLLRIELPWRIHNTFVRSVFVLFCALVSGSFAAALFLLLLGSVFITIPHELYDLLTTAQ